MNDNVKKTSAKPPKKLVPRTAPKLEEAKPTVTAETAAPVQPAAPQAPASPAPTAPKARAPRKPTAVEQTVAKHQKVLADALVKAQAIKYDQPKVMKPAPSKAGKADKPTKAEKPAKVKKVKLVRDSYAMPESEYARIGELRERLIAPGAPARKSELLRGGIAALASLNDTELKAIMGRVERIKTGRPKK